MSPSRDQNRSEAADRCFRPAAVGSSFALSRAGNSRLSALSAVFSTSESAPQPSQVARLAPPDDQRAPASPVFHVALGLLDDRDLFFQASLKSWLGGVI